MKKNKWMILIMALLITINVFLISSLYDKMSSNRSKKSVEAQGQVVNKGVESTHALEYLALKNDLSENYKEYLLKDYKSSNIMNVRIIDMSLAKNGNDVILSGELMNDSTIQVDWILMNIHLFNSAGKDIGLIPYPMLNSKSGDKPLNTGEKIALNHKFEEELKFITNANEWDGRFTVDILTTKDQSVSQVNTNNEVAIKDVQVEATKKAEQTSNKSLSPDKQLEEAIKKAVSGLSGIEIYKKNQRYAVEANYTLEDGFGLQSAAEKIAHDFTFAAYATGLPILRTSIIINKPDGIMGLLVSVGNNQASTQPVSTWTDTKIGPTIFINWVMEKANTDYKNIENHTTIKDNF
jgi:hypothetical protein